MRVVYIGFWLYTVFACICLFGGLYLSIAIDIVVGWSLIIGAIFMFMCFPWLAKIGGGWVIPIGNKRKLCFHKYDKKETDIEHPNNDRGVLVSVPSKVCLKCGKTKVYADCPSLASYYLGSRKKWIDKEAYYDLYCTDEARGGRALQHMVEFYGP